MIVTTYPSIDIEVEGCIISRDGRAPGKITITRPSSSECLSLHAHKDSLNQVIDALKRIRDADISYRKTETKWNHE